MKNVAVGKHTLLRVGAPEWEAINLQDSRERVEWALERTIEELAAVGTALSRTAHEILEAVDSEPSSDAGIA